MLDRGFITYSNQAKQDMLGVSAATLERAWRGQPRDRGRNGARRARACAGRSRGLGHRHCRAGWRQRGKAGRARAFCARLRARGKLVHAEKRFGDIGRPEIRKQSVLQAFVMLHDLAEDGAPRALPLRPTAGRIAPVDRDRRRRSNATAKRRNAVSNIAPISMPSMRLRNSYAMKNFTSQSLSSTGVRIPSGFPCG